MGSVAKAEGSPVLSILPYQSVDFNPILYNIMGILWNIGKKRRIPSSAYSQRGLTAKKEKRGCRINAGLKSGVLQVGFCICESPVTIGTKEGYY